MGTTLLRTSLDHIACPEGAMVGLVAIRNGMGMGETLFGGRGYPECLGVLRNACAGVFIAFF